MKKIVNYSILTTLTLLLALSSCVSESIIPTPSPYDGEPRTVSLRLVQPGATTRGVSRPVCDGEPVQFNGGDLYLTTTAGVIIRHFQITPRGGTATDIDNGIIRIDCLEAGQDIEEVPGSVSRVVFVGNPQAVLPTAGSIYSIISGTSGLVRNATHNTIATQHNVWNPGVNMFADEDLELATTQPVDPAAPRVWEAEITLAPTVARFELAKMTGMGNIESFYVAGIFIDNYFRQATRNSDFYPIGATPVNHGSVNSATNFAAGAHDYITMVTAGARTSGALFTAYSPALAAAARAPEGVVARPDGTYEWAAPCLAGCCAANTIVDNVWNFQVFAREFDAPGNATTTPPVIVIRLNNVYIRTGIGNETQNIGTQYLTVGSFNKRNPANNAMEELMGIRASNVYRINNLAFDEHDLHNVPNVEPITAEIIVELAEWNNRPTENDGFRQPNPIGGPMITGTAFNFPLGEAFNGSCTGNGSITYLWQRSTNGTDWVPALNPAAPLAGTAAYNPTVTETSHFRRVARCACGAYIISAPAQVLVPFLSVTPASAILFSAGGYRNITVRMNMAWTAQWVNPANGNTVAAPTGVTVTIPPANTSIVGIAQAVPTTPTDDPRTVIRITAPANLAGASGTLRITIGSGANVKYEDITFTQHAVDGEVPFRPDFFVGAFWRNHQIGERLITDPTHIGEWSATAISDGDWIILDRLASPTPGIIPLHTSDTPALNPNAATTSDHVYATGAISFRIGLTEALPPGAMPRYGKVIVSHIWIPPWGGGQTFVGEHIIWVRQGEAADFVMRREDPMMTRNTRDGAAVINRPAGTGTNQGRPVARRISPFNLTTTTWNTGLAQNGAIFTDFPSQNGAHFQWGSETFLPIHRAAWSPVGDAVPDGWDTRNVSSPWASVFPANTNETCPIVDGVHFRRPDDGALTTATTASVSNISTAHMLTSELRQSLFMIPYHGKNALNRYNSVTGFYADGFFDRQTRNTAVTVGTTSATIGTTVGLNSTNVASRGTLYFNPITGAHVFFPAAGRRTGVGAFADGGQLWSVGENGYYWTRGSAIPSGQFIATLGWFMQTRGGIGSQFNVVFRAAGKSVRCVVVED